MSEETRMIIITSDDDLIRQLAKNQWQKTHLIELDEEHPASNGNLPDWNLFAELSQLVRKRERERKISRLFFCSFDLESNHRSGLPTDSLRTGHSSTQIDTTILEHHLCHLRGQSHWIQLRRSQLCIVQSILPSQCSTFPRLSFFLSLFVRAFVSLSRRNSVVSAGHRSVRSIIRPLASVNVVDCNDVWNRE